MQKFFFAFFLVCLLSPFNQNILAQTSYQLQVEFTNIEDGGPGKLYVQILDKDEAYQSNHIIEAKEATILKVEGLKTGQYRVKVYHDVNNDGKLNTNYVGIPKEPYGFSNNVRPVFGPPKAEDMLFTIDKNTLISIRLQ